MPSREGSSGNSSAIASIGSGSGSGGGNGFARDGPDFRGLGRRFFVAACLDFFAGGAASTAGSGTVSPIRRGSGVVAPLLTGFSGGRCGDGRGHGEQDGHAHAVVLLVVEAGAGGDGHIGVEPPLEGADHFLHVGEPEVARAADRDDGVVDQFPDRLVAEQRAVEEPLDEFLRGSWMSPSTCATQQFSSASAPS